MPSPSERHDELMSWAALRALLAVISPADRERMLAFGRILRTIEDRRNNAAIQDRMVD